MEPFNPHSIGYGWGRAVRIGAVIQIVTLCHNPENLPLAKIAYYLLDEKELARYQLSDVVLFTLALPLIVLLPLALATSIVAPFYSGIAALACSVGSIIWMAHNGVLEGFFDTYGELFGACLMSVLLVYFLAAGLCAAQSRHVSRESRPFWLFLPPMVLTLMGWLNFLIAILLQSTRSWLTVAFIGSLSALLILVAWLGWWRAYAKAQKAAQ